MPKAQQHIRAFWNFTGHPKALAEGSQKVNEMLKQVQHDRNFGSLCKVLHDKYVSKAHSKHKPHATHAKRVAFTLAEVLITLAIIGIVAAMTIPTLVANYQKKAWNTSAQVFERKLEEALRQMNTQQVLAGYKSTADFVGALGKYFKINKVCQNDDIMSCFEDKVYWGADEEEVDMTTIKNASNFGQDDWDTETIGVQFANGTTGVIAYNPNCEQNAYSNQITGMSCLALLYDTDGFKAPNTQLKDLRSINVLSLDGKNCAIRLTDGTCFSEFFFSDYLTKQECEEQKNELNIQYCNSDTDYWAGALRACKDMGGTLPDANQLLALANNLYDRPIPFVERGHYDANLLTSKADKWGLNITKMQFFVVWENAEDMTVSSPGSAFGQDELGKSAWYRRFALDGTLRGTYWRSSSTGAYTMCVIP